jgi:GAF domain-containing protein
MRWAAGHRPESVRNYNREIDRTMAGLAYRRGELVESGDVREDPRFEADPRETRPFSSLVSIPLHVDERIVGAFTVISTRRNAFGPTDVSFIKLIGAMLDVILAAEFDAATWAAEQLEASEGEEPEGEPPAGEDGPKGA